jgi:hypothetical protein
MKTALEEDYDIRTVWKRLDYRGVRVTIIYAYMLNRGRGEWAARLIG